MVKGSGKFLAGILAGAVLMGTTAAFADQSISAILANSIKFKVNGVQKEVPKEYAVLSYKDHTYVPARFISEQLGATVGWDANTKTVSISQAAASTQKQGHFVFSQCRIDNSEFFTKVTGQITNTTKDVKTVGFRASLYSSDGTYLGTATGRVAGLEPGKTVAFEAVGNQHLEGASTFSMQISSEDLN